MRDPDPRVDVAAALTQPTSPRSSCHGRPSGGPGIDGRTLS